MEDKKKKRGLKANEWILIANVLVAAIAIFVLNFFGGTFVQSANQSAFDFILKCVMFDYGGEQTFMAFMFTAFIYINVLVLVGSIAYTSGSRAPRSLLGLLSFLIGGGLVCYSWAFFYKAIQPQLDNVIQWNATHPTDQTVAFNDSMWAAIMITGVLTVIVYILALTNLLLTAVSSTKKNLERKALKEEKAQAEEEIKEFVATFLKRTNHLDDYSKIWVTEEMDYNQLHKMAKGILRDAAYDEVVYDDGMNTYVNVKDGKKDVASDLTICVWKYDNAIAKQNLENFMKREEEYSTIAANKKKEEVTPVVAQPVQQPVVENKTVERYVEKTIIIHDGGVQPVEPKKVEPVPVVAPVIDAEDKNNPERIPFVEKLENSEKDIKNKYNELKAYLLGYGVKSRISISGDTFRLHKEEFAVITIAGKHLKIYLPLNLKDYKDTAIPVVDASHFKKYENLPVALNVRSDLSVKRAKQLIDDAMKKKGLTFKEPIVKNYAGSAISGAKQK